MGRIAFVVAMLLASAAQAQIVPVIGIQPGGLRDCGGVAFCQPVRLPPQVFRGTGTIVAAGARQYKPGKSLVLTAAHVTENATQYTVCDYPARLLSRERQDTADGYPATDLAMLEVDHDFAEHGEGYALDLGDDESLIGKEAKAIGYSGEKSRVVPGVIRTQQTINAQIVQGDSGGPIMYGGRVCGVIVGRLTSDPRVGSFIPLPTIHRFMERIRCGRYVCRYRQRGVVMNEVAPPPPIIEPRPIIQPQPQTPTPISQGPQGPAGERGPQGPPGERGPAGQQGPPGVVDPRELDALRQSVADLTVIVTSLKRQVDTLPPQVDLSVGMKQLQRDIDALKALKTPVRVVDPTGRVFSEDVVRLNHSPSNDGNGEPIVLRLVPRTKP